MRHQPVTTCIECGHHPPLPKRRICKYCYRPKNAANALKSQAKKKARIKEIMRVNEAIYSAEAEQPKEIMKGYLNYVFPKDYAGIRNL